MPVVNTIRRRLSLTKSRSGMASVEIALMLPFVVLLLLGSIEVANLLFLRNEMQAAASDTIREVATGGIELKDAESIIQDRLSQFTDATIIVDVQERKVGKGDEVMVSVETPLQEALLFNVFGGRSTAKVEESSIGPTPSRPSRANDDDDDDNKKRKDEAKKKDGQAESTKLGTRVFMFRQVAPNGSDS